MENFDFKAWRDKYGYTQEEAAYKLLFSTDTISRLENGYKPRNMHFIEMACKLHDLSKKDFAKITRKYS